MQKGDFRKTKRDNIEEFLSMSSDYINTYFRLMMAGNHDVSLKNEFFKSLFEYYKIMRKENMYLSFIMKNYKKVRSLETLYRILDDLDELNEKTYYFYQSVLEEYENLEEDYVSSNIRNKPSFDTLLETTRYEEELLGLLLTERDLDNYYKKENAYPYLKERTKVCNVSAEEGIGYFGLFTENDGEIITGIKLCVPQIVNLKTMLINVHEFKHGISLYPYIGYAIPNFDFETEAKMEEKRFVTKYLLKK